MHGYHSDSKSWKASKIYKIASMPLDVHAFFLPEGGVWAYLTVSFWIVYQFDDNSGSIYIYTIT